MCTFAHLCFLQDGPVPYIHTVFDRMCGDFLAKNTVRTLYIPINYKCMVLANPIPAGWSCTGYTIPAVYIYWVCTTYTLYIIYINVCTFAHLCFLQNGPVPVVQAWDAIPWRQARARPVQAEPRPFSGKDRFFAGAKLARLIVRAFHKGTACSMYVLLTRVRKAWLIVRSPKTKVYNLLDCMGAHKGENRLLDSQVFKNTRVKPARMYVLLTKARRACLIIRSLKNTRVQPARMYGLLTRVRTAWLTVRSPKTQVYNLLNCMGANKVRTACLVVRSKKAQGYNLLECMGCSQGWELLAW